MTLATSGVAAAAPSPGKKIEQQVKQHAQLLGEDNVDWALGAVEAAATTEAKLALVQREYAAGRTLSGLNALHDALVAVDRLSSRGDFLRFGIEQRLQDTTLTDQQRASLRAVRTAVDQLVSPLRARTTSVADKRIGATTPEASLALLKKTVRTAESHAKTWLLAAARRQQPQADAAREQVLIAWTIGDVARRTIWEQFVRDGDVTMKDCGRACVEYVTTPRVNDMYAEMGRVGRSQAGTIALFAGWIDSQEALGELQPKVKQALDTARSEAAAGRRDTAMIALLHAFDGLYGSAAALNFAARHDPSYWGEGAQPNPVDARNAAGRKLYSRQLAAFTRLRAEIAPSDAQVPPARRLPAKPWVLYPSGVDDGKGPYVFPASSSRRSGR